MFKMEIESAAVRTSHRPSQRTVTRADAQEEEEEEQTLRAVLALLPYPTHYAPHNVQTGESRVWTVSRESGLSQAGNRALRLRFDLYKLSLQPQ